MAAGDLTTLDAVRSYLSSAAVPLPSADESQLAAMITAVSAIFVADADHEIITREYTDTWSGSGGTRKALKGFPVTDVTSVTVDGVAIAERTTVGGSGWVLIDAEAGILELVGYTFTTGTANCVAVYEAGLGATAPADVDQACVDQVAYQFKMKDRIGITNESTSAGGAVTYLGGWQQQQGKDGQTPLFMATVNRYRRPI